MQFTKTEKQMFMLKKRVITMKTTREEVKEFLNLFRQLSEVQKIGAGMIAEGAAMMEEQKKNGVIRRSRS